MKRKATVFEEERYGDDASTFYSLPPTEPTSFTPQNAYTPTSFPSHLNSRTRKRYRDNRPDEDLVHQQTLAKLYGAQRQIHIQDAGSEYRTNPCHTDTALSGYPSSSLDGASEASSASDGSATGGRTQRSIESFFGGSKPPTALQVANAQYPQKDQYQNKLDGPRCEDCAAPLYTESNNSVSPLRNRSLPRLSTHDIITEDEWTCAQCRRQICDACAVRADYRLCLECAAP